MNQLLSCTGDPTAGGSLSLVQQLYAAVIAGDPVLTLSLLTRLQGCGGRVAAVNYRDPSEHMSLLHWVIVAAKAAVSEETQYPGPGRGTSDGFLPLNHATYISKNLASQNTDHLAVLSLLLSRGAKVHMSDKRGFTPVHLAAWYGLIDMADLLLRAHYKADEGYMTENSSDYSRADGVPRTQLIAMDVVNAAFPQGAERTPLMLASIKGDLAMCTYLLGSQYCNERCSERPDLRVKPMSDVSRKDGWGMTALDHATQRGYDAVVALLLISPPSPPQLSTQYDEEKVAHQYCVAINRVAAGVLPFSDREALNTARRFLLQKNEGDQRETRQCFEGTIETQNQAASFNTLCKMLQANFIPQSAVGF